MHENEDILLEEQPAPQTPPPEEAAAPAAEIPASEPSVPVPQPVQEPIGQPVPKPVPQSVPEPMLQSAPERELASIPEMQPSRFVGKTIQLIGWRLLGILLTGITLGIGAPWAHCMVLRWEAKHTLVEGQRLQFDGKGHQLLGRYLLWGLLTLVTFGIFIIFLPVRFHKWHTKHLSFAGSGAIPEKKLSGGIIALIAVALAIGLLLVGLGGFMAYRAFTTPAEQLTEPTLPPTSESTTAPTTEATTEATTGVEVWYVNSPTGLYVRDCADEDYTTIDYLEYGTEVLVEYWEGKLGFIGYGWCNGDYLTQEKPEALPQGGGNQGGNQNDSGNSRASIVGNWYGFSLSDSGTWLTLHTTWCFKSDGTFELSHGESGYTYSEETGLQMFGTGADWYTGTYELNGDVLELTFLEGYLAGGEPSHESYPIVTVYDGISVSSNTLYLYGGDPLYKGDPNDLALWLLTR